MKFPQVLVEEEGRFLSRIMQWLGVRAAAPARCIRDSPTASQPYISAGRRPLEHGGRRGQRTRGDRRGQRALEIRIEPVYIRAGISRHRIYTCT